jgi:predicted nucleic acid-binding Zn ribbon protein
MVLFIFFLSWQWHCITCGGRRMVQRKTCSEYSLASRRRRRKRRTNTSAPISFTCSAKFYCERGDKGKEAMGSKAAILQSISTRGSEQH